MTNRQTLAKPGTLLFALIVAACGQADAGDGPGGRRGPPAMRVDVAAAIRDTAIDQILATGEIEAVQQIELRPEVDGRIVRILFREGSEVGRGAPLFKVDDAELTAQVARLEAERDLASQALARTRQLLAEEAASESELETAEARARSTQADLDLAQVRLDRTTVRAPFAGVTGERLVSLGDYVTSSTSLVTLQTVDPQRAAFEVPERYAARLEVGQTVSFQVASVPDREFQGTVDFVDPVVRLPARTISVKALVPNRDRALQAGMFIEARLATEIRPDAVLVPEDAILTLEMGSFIWVVAADNTATRRPVLLGIRTPGLVEILEGVEAGETVVVGGLERLFEGAGVMPLPAEGATAPLDTDAQGQEQEEPEGAGS
jgi:membrane fusion protein (multidrug efflux system)